MGYSLTVAPTDAPQISKQQAESIALSAVTGYPGAQAVEAAFGELHSSNGTPASGQVVWIVNVDPPGGIKQTSIGGADSSPVSWTNNTPLIFINAETGAIIQESL
jgi:hypothetical protein